MVAAKKQITPAAMPMMMDPVSPTKPEAGVMATRPATAPDAMPRTEGLPLAIHSVIIHESAATAVATCVTTMSLSARAYHRILKVARTIADLALADVVAANHG